MEQLKNNEYLPTQTFEEFISRKKIGKKTYFLNKTTLENAKAHSKEYKQILEDNEK